MKRLLLALFSGFLFVFPVISQVTNFSQRGRAVQELTAAGLTASHPSLPINSRATVRNAVTGAETEVTITGRIPAARDRIIDLSPGAWEALGLTAETEVIISTSPPARPRPAVAQEPPPVIDGPLINEPQSEPIAVVPPVNEPVIAEVEPAKAAEPAQPLSITINAYISTADGSVLEKTSSTAGSTETAAPGSTWTTAPGSTAAAAPGSTAAAAAPSNTDFLAWLMAMDAREGREAREAREYREDRAIRGEERRDSVRIQQPQSPSQQPVQFAQPPQPQQQQQPQIIYIQPSYAADPPPAAPVQQPQQYIQATPLYSHQPVQTIQSPPPQPVYHQQFVQPPQPVYEQQPVYTPRQSYTDSPPPAAYTPAPQQPQQPMHFVQPPQQSTGIEIIPGWPNPYVNRVYRLQVGSFSAPEAAARAEQYIWAAGFTAGREMYGSLHRVLVLNVHAADVYNSVNRLAAYGFRQFWVRD
ncbi:MAG: hypothetical protein FWG99_01825 [Treponema sp.]|nr:hypothetical protein [Treponema sp.]